MEYVVKIGERFTHSLIVDAASREEAIAAGYQLLTDGMTPEMEKDYGYELEADGYTGENDAWEY